MNNIIEIKPKYLPGDHVVVEDIELFCIIKYVGFGSLGPDKIKYFVEWLDEGKNVRNAIIHEDRLVKEADFLGVDEEDDDAWNEFVREEEKENEQLGLFDNMPEPDGDQPIEEEKEEPKVTVRTIKVKVIR